MARSEPFEPDLSVLVVHYNTPDLLDPFFKALAPSVVGLQCEVILIDNASRIDCRDRALTLWPGLHFVRSDTNLGFGRANNEALKKARGKAVLLLNTDAFVAPDAIREALACLHRDPRNGIVGARLVGRDGILQPSCRRFPTPWRNFATREGLNRFWPRMTLVDDLSWPHDADRECDWVTGAFYLIRRELLDQIGLFDPRYFLYCEEVDHCMRARQAGWRVVFCAKAHVVHLGGESALSLGVAMARGQISAYQAESECLYFRKHSGLLGVVAHVALSFLAGGIDLLKALLRRRLSSVGPELRREFSVLLAAASVTRLGTVSPR